MFQDVKKQVIILATTTSIIEKKIEEKEKLE